MAIRKSMPKSDGSGKGVGANRGRGGCKPIKRSGLKKTMPVRRGTVKRSK